MNGSHRSKESPLASCLPSKLCHCAGHFIDTCRTKQQSCSQAALAQSPAASGHAADCQFPTDSKKKHQAPSLATAELSEVTLRLAVAVCSSLQRAGPSGAAEQATGMSMPACISPCAGTCALHSFYLHGKSPAARQDQRRRPRCPPKDGPHGAHSTNTSCKAMRPTAPNSLQHPQRPGQQCTEGPRRACRSSSTHGAADCKQVQITAAALPRRAQLRMLGRSCRMPSGGASCRGASLRNRQGCYWRPSQKKCLPGPG